MAEVEDSLDDVMCAKEKPHINMQTNLVGNFSPEQSDIFDYISSRSKSVDSKISSKEENNQDIVHSL